MTPLEIEKLVDLKTGLTRRNDRYLVGVLINKKPTGKMLQCVAANKDFLFVVSEEGNKAFAVYNERIGNLFVQHDAMPNALVNGFIDNQSYAYYTDSNNPIVYRPGYRAFVAGYSGEDSGCSDGDGENGVCVDSVLQIKIPGESFRKKCKKSCANSFPFYVGGVDISNFDTRSVYIIKPPSERDSTTLTLFDIMQKETSPAPNCLFTETSSTGISVVSIHI